MKTNLLLTSEKKLSYLILSFPINAHWLKTLVSFLPTESLTDKSLSNIIFTDNDIGKIIKGLDPNKAHSHYMISIRMLKLCGDSVYKPLRLIFRACLDQGIFPLCWKKATSRPILASKGRLRCFRKKVKDVEKGQNIWEFVQECTKFENILKKGKWLHAIIARNKLIEKALNAVHIHKKWPAVNKEI